MNRNPLLNAVEACHANIDTIERSLDEGNPLAIVAAVEVTQRLTIALHLRWFGNTRRCPATADTSTRIAAFREALHFFCGGDEVSVFPTLAFPEGSDAAKRQRAMLRGLKHGPWFGEKHAKRPAVQRLFEHVIVPTFQGFRFGLHSPSTALEAEIAGLPQLSRRTIRIWVHVIVQWLIATKPHALSNADSPLYRLATERRQKQNLSRKRHRLGKFKSRRTAESGTDGMEPDDRAEYERRLMRITAAKRRTASLARIKSGLTEAFTTWLNNTLP